MGFEKSEGLNQYYGNMVQKEQSQPVLETARQTIRDLYSGTDEPNKIYGPKGSTSTK